MQLGSVPTRSAALVLQLTGGFSVAYSSARRPAAVVGALLLAVALAACGSSDNQTAPAATGEASGGFPVQVVTGAVGSDSTITIEQKPDAIISLSPSATETLFAIGAGDQVIAVDDQSSYPAEAPRTNLSGYQPNVEAILNYSPDLVVTATPDDTTISGLSKAGVPTLVLPAVTDFDGVYNEIERLGTATGHIESSKELVSDMRARIDQAVSEAPQAVGVTYFHELDPTLYTVTSDSFIGQVYGLFGLVNIADAAPSGGGYVQLSEESVVEANPDVIFLADAAFGGASPEEVAQRPGWSQITAVELNQIFVLDPDISSRWGPRVVDFVEDIGADVSQLSLVAA